MLIKQLQLILFVVVSLLMQYSKISAQQANVLNQSEAWFAFRNSNGGYYATSVGIDLYEVISENPLMAIKIDHGSSYADTDIGAKVNMLDIPELGDDPLPVFSTALHYSKYYIIVFDGQVSLKLPLYTGNTSGDMRFTCQQNSSGAWNLTCTSNGRGVDYQISTEDDILTVQNTFDNAGYPVDNRINVNGTLFSPGSEIYVSNSSYYTFTAVD